MREIRQELCNNLCTASNPKVQKSLFFLARKYESEIVTLVPFFVDMMNHIDLMNYLYPTFLIYLLLCFFFPTFYSAQDTAIYSSDNGSVTFSSDAPLEMIQAQSSELKGVIDAQKRTFAFSVILTSFEGFNSPLQREHFNETYLESERYPKASFIGKIIENADLTKPGNYTIRTKGILSIHGVEQERIIRSTVRSSKEKGLEIQSSFTILLDDHDIRIPKVVNQKIAQEIAVRVEARFVQQ